MRNHTIFLLLVGLVQVTLAQNTVHTSRVKIVQPDTTKQAQTFIPRNLEECLSELNRLWDSAFVDKFKRTEESELAKYHFTLGIWLRNNWGLWKGDTLARWFNSIGIVHPDDMSGIIIQSYWRELNSKPIDLDVQVQYYQDFWKKSRSHQEQ